MTDKAQVKQEIFAPAHLGIHFQMVVCNYLAAVQLVPENAIVEICRILHHVSGKLFAGQKSPFPDMLFFREYCLIYPVEISNDQITVKFLRCVDEGFRGIRGQPVITVHKLQIVTFGNLDGTVTAVRNTGIFFINDVKAWVHLRIFLADGKTFVGTSVVDYQDLHIFKGLLHGAGQTAAKIFFSIINRNDQ